ncbi:MAG TPA: UvrD-helicase domain-containing protein [Steroidobacteraceae bacterium]
MSTPDPLAIDRRAREEALAVQRSLLLQAPAGSGKTTVLTARFLALLAGADAPEEILAITFTRKAAAEMRHRILAALHAAGTGGEIRGIDATLLQAVAQRDRTRGWQLLRNSARLRIETIDALSHRLASALPVTARSGPALEITPTPAPLYRRAARRALREALLEPESSAAAQLLLERLDNGWRRLERLLADMLERRSHWLPRVLDARGSGFAPRVADSLVSAVRAHLAGLSARLPAPLLREGEALLAQLGHIRAGAAAADACALDSDPAHLPHWRALCALATTAKGSWRRRLTSSEGFAATDAALKQRAADWIAALAAQEGAQNALCSVRSLPEVALSGADQLAIEALALLLTRAAAELQLLFAEYGKVDYMYIAAAARQALSEQGEPSDFALRTGAAVCHILVDEFQDVSFEQFELLRSLTAGWERGDGRTLFIVGDPMQSIYQFREAEVGLFLRARDHGLGGIGLEMLELRRNFRSRAPLIAWINEHFARLFPAEDDARLAAVRYLPSAPAHEAHETQDTQDTQDASGAPHAAVTLHRVEAADAEAVRVVQIVHEARAHCAQASIAVLVAGREHAAAIVAHLRAAGIALRGLDLERLRERAVIRDLSSLARVLLHGADRPAWLALLRAPWCGASLVQLERWLSGVDGDLFVALRGQASADVHGARLARLCAALEPAIAGAERGWPLWQRVQRSWLRLAGPAIYPGAAERLDARRFIDALALHDEPETLVGEAMGKLTERLYSSAPPQPGAVEVLTMHAAKGLEWDVVIVPGLGRRTAGDQDPLLHWIELPRASEGTDLLLAPIRATDEEPQGSLAAYIKGLRRARQRLERVRLLYVAATRARSALHLLGALEPRASGEASAPASGSLLEILWPAVSAEFIAADIPLPASRELPVPTVPSVPDTPLWRLPAAWSLPALPTEPGPQRLLLSAPVTGEAPEYSWVGLTARAVGTIVHAELHRLACARVLPPPQDLQTRAAYYGAWLAELGVPAAEQDAAKALVLEALERTLADTRGRWLLSDTHHQARSEWRLSGVHEGRIVNVVLDRMLIDEQGRRWIVDYKTSRHEGGAVETFIASEAERYLAQMQRYAALAAGLGTEPVHAALYFPLLGVFRELAL